MAKTKADRSASAKKGAATRERNKKLKEQEALQKRTKDAVASVKGPAKNAGKSAAKLAKVTGVGSPDAVLRRIIRATEERRSKGTPR